MHYLYSLVNKNNKAKYWDDLDKLLCDRKEEKISLGIVDGRNHCTEGENIVLNGKQWGWAFWKENSGMKASWCWCRHTFLEKT